MKIILDTDFILTSLKYKVDIISELNRILDEKYAINIIDKTLDELKGKKLEKLALTFLKTNNINLIKTNKLKTVDNHILDIINKNTAVATQDKDLKRELKNKDIRIITIRQKKYLTI